MCNLLALKIFFHTLQTSKNIMMVLVTRERTRKMRSPFEHLVETFCQFYAFTMVLYEIFIS